MNLIRIIGNAFSRERDHWLLWAPLAIGAGLVIYFQLPFEPPLWALAAMPVLVLPIWPRDCAAKTVIDDTELWSHGAHVIYFSGNKMRIDYTRERRGMRPWSVGWKNKSSED